MARDDVDVDVGNLVPEDLEVQVDGFVDAFDRSCHDADLGPVRGVLSGGHLVWRSDVASTEDDDGVASRRSGSLKVAVGNLARKEPHAVFSLSRASFLTVRAADARFQRPEVCRPRFELHGLTVLPADTWSSKSVLYNARHIVMSSCPRDQRNGR